MTLRRLKQITQRIDAKGFKYDIIYKNNNIIYIQR